MTRVPAERARPLHDGRSVARQDRTGLVQALAAALVLGTLTGCGSTLARVDPQLFPDPSADAITFWGHACCYIDVGGYGIITDPVFENRLFMRRRKRPAPPPSAYARTRLILISHAHDDHLSVETIATFPESVLVLCPEPAARELSEFGERVRPMKLGDTFEFPGGRVVAVAAEHPGTKYGADAEADGRALGYVVQTRRDTLYYSGDTDYFEGFARVASTFRPRVTLLNVNGHLRSKNAVQAARDLGSPVVVPIHRDAYGFYVGGPRKLRDADELRRELGGRLRELGLGESLPFGREPVQPARRAP